MRLRLPPTQRRPSPKIAGEAVCTLPCRKMLSAVGSSPEEISTTLSGLVCPEAASTAPPVVPEFSQPWPAAPLLPHGHGEAVPSPKQNAWPTDGDRRSCPRISPPPLLSVWMFVYVMFARMLLSCAAVVFANPFLGVPIGREIMTPAVC